MKDRVRDAALRFLCDCERDSRYMNIAIGKALDQFTEERDRAFFTLLVYGVAEKKVTLDYCISRYSSRPVSELERFTKYILRLGFYQLIFLKTPGHAAVNETVALARQSGERGFVNAVLRSYLRDESFAFPSKENGTAEYLSVRYSCPEWICRSFMRDYGEEKAESILCALSEKQDLTVRVNTLRTDRDTLLARMPDAAVRTNYSPNGIRIPGNVDVPSLPGFEEGLFMVQDEASMLAAEILSPVPGDLCVDVCAAPGTKSFCLALLADGKCDVRSFDLHRSKIPLITDGAEKYGLSCITASVQDARFPRSALRAKADRLLCDVPCSGLGVMAKKPDIKDKSEADADGIADAAYAILSASAAYLKKNGRMVFSTCTLRKKENEENAARFLAEHPAFVPEDFTVTGADGRELRSENGMLTLFPDEAGTDGFFISRFANKGQTDG